MGKLNIANIRKTIFYLKRNGIYNTLLAVRERASESAEAYVWEPVTESVLKEQREKAAELNVGCISVVVPTFRTPEKYLREMIDSVLGQSYYNLELVLADATDGDGVKNVVETYADDRIRYIKLEENAGIAPNTNVGLLAAKGDYVGLLDHDDLLTQDALYEVASRICEEKKENNDVCVVYSDEDKCNGDATDFYEPHRKEKFNLDLLLSNNYICHFTVMKRELIQKLLLRKEFDGAQDFDLVLRASAEYVDAPEKIVHIDKVLYHWRCHSGSTAENPASKMYAYEAGCGAVQDFANSIGWKAKAVNSKHLGFYQLQYDGGIFAQRKDVGAVGGKVLAKGSIIGGRMDTEGNVYYEGLQANYSGYMHRASMSQDAEVLDIRNIQLAEDLQYLTKELFGVPYQTVKNSSSMIFDATCLPRDIDRKKASLQLSKAISDKGRRLVFLPEMKTVSR